MSRDYGTRARCRAHARERRLVGSPPVSYFDGAESKHSVARSGSMSLALAERTELGSS